MTHRAEDRFAVEFSLFVVRVIVGIIFFYHGAQKMFGWYGGHGLTATAEQMGPIGYLVAIGECFGGLGLIVGFLTRFSAASLIVIMIGAIVQVHGPKGFGLANGGYEYNLALIGLLVPVLLAGPGAFAIGRFLPLPKSGGSSRPIVALE